MGLASLAACARRVVGTCALENAWGSLHSPPALEGRVLAMCESDMAGTQPRFASFLVFRPFKPFWGPNVLLRSITAVALTGT